MNDINGQLYGSKKSSAKYYNRNVNDQNLMLKSAQNRNTMKGYNNNDYNNNKYKSQNLENKKKESLLFYDESNKNKKYNNKRYEDKEDEKEESSEIFLNNNKDKRINLNPDDNIKMSIKRKTQLENEFKRSSRYYNNIEEQKYDENEMGPKLRHIPKKYSLEKTKRKLKKKKNKKNDDGFQSSYTHSDIVIKK